MNSLSGLSGVSRSHLVRTGFRAAATATILVVLYYLLPIEHRAHQSVALRLGVALAFFAAVSSPVMTGP